MVGFKTTPRDRFDAKPNKVKLQIAVTLKYSRDLCKLPLFTQFLCQDQILILEILYVFLWLKFSPSLNLSKNEHFSKVSSRYRLRFRPGEKGLFN